MVLSTSHIYWEKHRAKLTSVSAWTIPKQSSSIAPEHVWSNPDQDPVPLNKRTWDGVSFVTYWFSDLITIAGWSACSSIITTGLTATDAIMITFVAAICNAIPTVLNGAIGADLNIPFPIAVRASYGYWLSYFCVVSRGILALFWFGIQSANGGACVTTVITAIWPSYAALANHLPVSAGITTQGMVSYLIYWLIQFPCLLVPTHKLRYLFLTKTILVLPTALAMVVWIAVKAGRSGAFFNQPATVHGSERAWLWLSTLTSVTGGFSTIACNIMDFSRYSRKPGSQVWQLPFIPLFKIIIDVFGIISASAAKEVYGKALWSPTDIMAEWSGTSGGRAAMFFSGSVWLLAQVCVNVSANSISLANDLTTLAPKYFNIRRGVIFGALVGGFAMVPWIIVKSASTFLSFMSAYAIFMAPIAGVLVSDYWIVKRRKYDVPALYDPHGIYYYQYGCNWRALVSTLVTIVPLLPGLAHKVTPDNVHISIGLQHLFTFNWLYGFCLSVVMYTTLNIIWKDPQTLISRVVRGDMPVLEGFEVDIEVSSERQSQGNDGKIRDIHQAKEIGEAGKE